MGEREAFGPNLRRIRVQRGISLERIAAGTKVGVELWDGMERNDFSRWPSGIYARAYIRAYALEIGVDPDTTVDDFCRWFPHGDRRASRIVREQAALVGHDLHWNDDLPDAQRDRRTAPSPADEPARALAHTRTMRLIAAAVDAAAVLALGTAMSAFARIGWSGATAMSAVIYHAVALATLGCSPAVWALDAYLANREPAAHRAVAPRILRPVRNTQR